MADPEDDDLEDDEDEDDDDDDEEESEIPGISELHARGRGGRDMTMGTGGGGHGGRGGRGGGGHGGGRGDRRGGGDRDDRDRGRGRRDGGYRAYLRGMPPEVVRQFLAQAIEDLEPRGATAELIGNLKAVAQRFMTDDTIKNRLLPIMGATLNISPFLSQFVGDDWADVIDDLFNQITLKAYRDYDRIDTGEASDTRVRPVPFLDALAQLRPGPRMVLDEISSLMETNPEANRVWETFKARSLYPSDLETLIVYYTRLKSKGEADPGPIKVYLERWHVKKPPEVPKPEDLVGGLAKKAEGLFGKFESAVNKFGQALIPPPPTPGGPPPPRRIRRR